jgi:hypothetical protein
MMCEGMRYPHELRHRDASALAAYTAASPAELFPGVSDFLVARKFAAVCLCDGELQIFDLLSGQLVLRRRGGKPQQQFACHVLAFGGEVPHGLNSLIQQRRHKQNNSNVSRTCKCCAGTAYCAAQPRSSHEATESGLRPAPCGSTGPQLYELLLGCGVPMYGNALRMSVCGLRPLLGISPFDRNARR